MPKRISIKVDDVPYQYKNRKLQIGKSYTSPDFSSHTVLTDDIFTYIDFYFSSHKKAMKYRNPTVSKIKYGDEKKYHYSFYWKQAMSFYKAAKTLPMESVPLFIRICRRLGNHLFLINSVISLHLWIT